MMYIIDSPMYDQYYIYNEFGTNLYAISKTNPNFDIVPEEILTKLSSMKRLTSYNDVKKHINDDIATLYFGEPSINKLYILIAGAVLLLFFFIGRKK